MSETDDAPGGHESTGAAAAGTPVDMSRLRALVGDDDEFIRELCEAFLVTTDEILPQLERALATEDRKALASAAHKLKGGSQGVCAERIAVLAFTLERDAPSRSLQELGAVFTELQRAVKDCADYLRDTVH